MTGIAPCGSQPRQWVTAAGRGSRPAAAPGPAARRQAGHALVCHSPRVTGLTRDLARRRRAIGSAGERLVHTEEVTGSIPVSPTRQDVVLKRALAAPYSSKVQQ